MYNKTQSEFKLNNRSLSSKNLQNGRTRQQIKQYYLQSHFLYQKLFSFIKEQKFFYTNPEPLRHPLIFYYGHTSSLYINKLLDKGLISQRVNPKFQALFEVGVNEMDWDDLNYQHYDWPSVREVTAFRNKVKNVVLEVIEKTDPLISWDSDAWVIMMGIEHERIHFETSSVIMRRMSVDQISPYEEFVDCQIYTTKREQTPKNQMKTVPSYKTQWDRQIENAKCYGWDNQFGQHLIDVKSFKASTMLVSNGEYLEFIEDNGYEAPQFWDEQGKAWLKSTKPKMPLFWRKDESGYKLKTMSKLMPMPMDWPVQVCNLQATAFCIWKSIKTGKNIRLPTQDEYFAMRVLFPKDQHQQQHGQAGNINMEYWFSPNPVNYFKTGDFYDVLGNVWQHNSTQFYPFQNFKIHSSYQDFSTTTYDGRHYLIKGGCFLSTGDEAIKHTRFAFRRHFYQFVGFRYVESENPVQTHKMLDQQDKVVQQFLKIHYLTPNSYAEKVCEIVSKHFENQKQNCLTVGCSVGRIVLQAAKFFKYSYGIDYSARFFQMVTRLYEKNYLKYKDIEIDTKNLEIDKDRLILEQMNPQNPDPKKINGCSVAILDGIALKDKTIKKVLKSINPLLQNKALLIVTHTDNRNKIELEDFKDIANKAQLIQAWSVPPVGAQNFQVRICMYQVQFSQ